MCFTSQCVHARPIRAILLFAALYFVACRGYEGDRFTILRGQLYTTSGSISPTSYKVYLGYPSYGRYSYLQIIDTLYCDSTGRFELAFISDPGRRLRYWIPFADSNGCYLEGIIEEGIINTVEAHIVLPQPLLAIRLQDSTLSKPWHSSRLSITETDCALTRSDFHPLAELPGKQPIYLFDVVPDMQHKISLYINSSGTAIVNRDTTLFIGRDTVWLDW